MMANSTRTVFGVLLFNDSFSVEDLLDSVREIEALGYESVWLSEILGRDVYVTAAHVLANTTRIKVGSGIAQIYGRDAVAAAQAARSLSELSGGRFLHGIGLSHRKFAELRGLSWEDPVQKATEYVTAVRQPGVVSPPIAEEHVPVYLAAHGPRMLQGPAQVADGVMAYMQTPESCADIRATVGSEKTINVVVPCCLTDDPVMGREVGRQAVGIYLELPAYQRLLRGQGFTEDDWSNGGSDRVVDTWVNWGTVSQISDRFQAYLEAGATNVIMFPHPSADVGPGSLSDMLEAFAPAKSQQPA